METICNDENKYTSCTLNHIENILKRSAMMNIIAPVEHDTFAVRGDPLNMKRLR